MINIEIPKLENTTLKALSSSINFLCESIIVASNEQMFAGDEGLSTYLAGVAFGYRQTLQLIRAMEVDLRKGDSENE